VLERPPTAVLMAGEWRAWCCASRLIEAESSWPRWRKPYTLGRRARPPQAGSACGRDQPPSDRSAVRSARTASLISRGRRPGLLVRKVCRARVIRREPSPGYSMGSRAGDRRNWQPKSSMSGSSGCSHRRRAVAGGQESTGPISARPTPSMVEGGCRCAILLDQSEERPTASRFWAPH